MCFIITISIDSGVTYSIYRICFVAQTTWSFRCCNTCGEPTTRENKTKFSNLRETIQVPPPRTARMQLIVGRNWVETCWRPSVDPMLLSPEFTQPKRESEPNKERMREGESVRERAERWVGNPIAANSWGLSFAYWGYTWLQKFRKHKKQR